MPGLPDVKGRRELNTSIRDELVEALEAEQMTPAVGSHKDRYFITLKRGVEELILYWMESDTRLRIARNVPSVGDKPVPPDTADGSVVLDLICTPGTDTSPAVYGGGDDGTLTGVDAVIWAIRTAVLPEVGAPTASPSSR